MSNRNTLRGWLGTAALCAASIAAAETPTLKLLSAPLVTPDNAWQYYESLPNWTVHSNGISPWTTAPPEIVELGRALGAEQRVNGQISVDEFARRVAEYVRNNIDVEFRFGLGKGARGAIIDQSGTPFDQAQLMFELLKQGNVSASYKVGRITLTAQEFGQWTGVVKNLVQATPPALPTFTVDGKAACQFLADGGIPAAVNTQTSCAAVTGDLTTVTLAHVWILANSKLYDPSFKRYNLRKGVDLGAALGCGTDATPTCGSGAVTAAFNGAIPGTLSGQTTWRTINESQLGNSLKDRAIALQTVVEASLPDAPLEDVVGGWILDESFVPAAAGATLPYVVDVRYTWTTDIPNPFRTRFRFHYRTMDPLMYVDELYGRRLNFTQVIDLSVSFYNAILMIDDAESAVDPAPTTPTPINFFTVVDHPYAASSGAYGDETLSWDNSPFPGQSQAILLTLGNTGEGFARHFADREHAAQQTPYFDLEQTFPMFSFVPASNTLFAAQLLYQETLAVRLLEGVSRTRITQHHAIGMTGDQRVTLGSHVSVNSPSNVAAARTAAFEALAAVGSMIEGSLLQQQQDVFTPNSAPAYFSILNSHGVSFLDVSAATLGNVLPTLTGTYGYNGTRLQASATAGYNFILPLSAIADNTSVPITGGLYYTIGIGELQYRSDSLAYLMNGYLKGGGIAPGVDDPVKAALSSVKPQAEAPRLRDAISVNPANGDFTLTPPPDLVTGAGAFPYSLPFQRTYVSSNTYTEVVPAPWNSYGSYRPSGWLDYRRGYYGSDANSFARLGGGWTHNYQITASMGNDGATALGARRGVDALASIAALYTLTDLGTSLDFRKRLTSVFAAHWLSQQFMANVVNVELATNVSRFVRLPSGTLRAPPASAERLVQTGSRSGPLCLECATNGNGIVRQPRTGFDYQNITLAYTDQRGGAIAFSTTERLKVAIGNTLTEIARPTFAANTWTFPSGVVVTFNYEDIGPANAGSPMRSLRSVSNNLGRSLTFTVTNVTGSATASSYGLRKITAVTDETNRQVFFGGDCSSSGTNPGNDDPLGPWGNGPYGCHTFEVTTPDGKVSKYNYDTVAGSPQSSTASRPPYRLRRWFTPDDGSVAFLTVDYDSMYRVKGVVDKAGIRTQYFASGLYGGEHQARGEMLDPLLAATTQYFNQYGKLVSMIDPLGRTSWKTYDDRQRVKSEIQPEGNAADYTYDVRSNVLTEVRRPKPGSTWLALTRTYTYVEGPTIAACVNAARCNLPATSLDYKGRVTDYTYNTAGQITRTRGPTLSGSIRAETDFCYSTLGGISFITGKIDVAGTDVLGAAKPNRVMTYSYKATNKYVLDKMIMDPPSSLTTACAATTKASPLNLITALTFDTLGNVQTLDGPRTDVTDVTTYTFDSMRRLKQVDGPAGTSAKVVFDYYDDGALHTTDRQEMVGGTPVMRRETRTYNSIGALDTVTDAEGNVTRFTYDTTGRPALVTDPDGRRTATVYDLAGQTRCIWKGWNSAAPPTIWRSSDPASCSWDPAEYVTAGNDGRYLYAEYDYTDNGKRKTIRDANSNITELVYDKHDRLRYSFLPASATGSRCTAPTSETISPAPTCPSGATYEELRYSTSGDPATSSSSLCAGNDQACRKRTRGGSTVTFTYDGMNRAATKAASNLPTVTYAYNLVSEPLSAISPVSGDGLIPAHRTAYGYDDAGRRSFEENTLNGVVRQVAYAYNSGGNRSSTTWPNGYLVSYEYDALSRLSKVWEGAIGTIKLADYSYDSLSRRQQLQFANQPNNRTTYTYEPDSNLDLLTNILAGTTVSLDYGHNASGQIRSITGNDNFYLPAPPATSSAAYVVTKLNTYGSVGGQAVTYDNAGNLLTWFPPASSKHTYTYDAENRLRTAAVDGTATASIRYDYDALGRRISKVVNGTATYYVLDGEEEIAELDAAGTTQRQYVTGTGVDDRIARIEGGTRYYYHVNHQGSVLAMSTDTGALNQQLAYDEYGVLTSQQPPASTLGEPFRFTGRRFDPETGLYYYRARYYAPTIGRFLQTDPAGYKDDINLYAYVGNDPSNKSDPSGLAEYNCSNPASATCNYNQPLEKGDKVIYAGNTYTITGIAGSLVSYTVDTATTCIGAEQTVNTAPQEQSESEGGDLSETLAQTSAGAGGPAALLEHGSGKTRVGSNGSMYFETAKGGVYRGGRTVSTASLARIGRAASHTVAVVGTVADISSYRDGEMGGDKLAMNLTMTAVGVFGGPVGAAAAVTYFVGDAAISVFAPEPLGGMPYAPPIVLDVTLFAR